ncbi:MAG: uroporphyrinogen-III C-methyltransferase [Rhodospirillales bacterium]|nr:uroporphyrinogen-III C-methyltransferase [Rhodospirillales bacterium]MDH3793268.1 uroporphyrinogen-III C-methyltransferase [Rhodospirillales bacterium]MDH3910699.1 uroporphyrinogen-III C-methyltransferase [Rhodospirillales bacterium]MDH3966779.1 uroporphyrinogen-III C-methyltransferase [Rhodospirillales bacterium]
MSAAGVPVVHLVGAGPGDPDLLTVKALRLLQGAEVVVYDRLVAPAILELIPPGAARIYVGKADRRHTLPQDEINALLVKLARTGHGVVRLKGGDPFVFGRGSEEAEHLARHGIAFEIVPGVTAASGCTAGFGIPLTHRGLASGVRFVTGHCRDDGELELNWASLADPDTTLVVYMGLATLPKISRRLIEAGLPPDTPAAAIAKGTTPGQTLCRGTLANLPAKTAGTTLKAPVLIVIGRVVTMAEVLGALPGRPDVVASDERQARHA